MLSKEICEYCYYSSGNGEGCYLYENWRDEGYPNSPTYSIPEWCPYQFEHQLETENVQ